MKTNTEKFCACCGWEMEGATTGNEYCDECDDNNNNPEFHDPDLQALDLEASRGRAELQF